MATNGQPHTGRWVLLATIVPSSMVFIDSSALNVALSALQKDLNATGMELLWIINAYVLLLGSLILLGGSLGDHYGRNRIFRIGIVIFSASSFVCGIAPTVGVLIAARAVQGIGGALMVPGSLAIISASFGSEERSKAIGTWASFGSITTILAPALGGILASAGLWRGVFFINLPLAAIAVFALARVPESKDDQASRRLDYPGTVLITLALAGLTYGATGLGQSSDTANPGPFLALIAGFGALIAFVIVEARSDHPMIPLSLFRQRTFSGINLMTLFLYGALSGALFFVPLNLIQVQGYNASVAGLTFLPLSLLLAVLSPLSGRLVSRVGSRVLLTIGPIIVGIGFVLFALPGLTNGPADYWRTYLPAIIALGIGMGITVAPLTTALMSSVPSHESGVASGINNAVTRSAQGLAVAIFGAVALASFAAGLSTRLAQSQLAPAIQQQIRQNSSKLGNTDIPENLDDTSRAEVQQAIRLSFVDTFRLVSYIGAAMAWISAIAAALLVENRLQSLDTEKAVERSETA